MADLAALIRVRRHTVEEKQKFLADLYRQVESMQHMKTRFEEQIERERKVTDELASAEAIAYFGRYSVATRKKIDQLEREIGKLETRIEIAREDMRAAFAELKKIEITQERRRKEQEKERNKKEDRELDEIGIDGHRRGREESR